MGINRANKTRDSCLQSLCSRSVKHEHFRFSARSRRKFYLRARVCEREVDHNAALLKSSTSADWEGNHQGRCVSLFVFLPFLLEQRVCCVCGREWKKARERERACVFILLSWCSCLVSSAVWRRGNNNAASLLCLTNLNFCFQRDRWLTIKLRTILKTLKGNLSLTFKKKKKNRILQGNVFLFV